MPTIIYADGFEHRTVSALDFGGVDGEGIFDTVQNVPQVTINTTDQRTGNACLQIAANAAATFAQKVFRGADPNRVVHGLYIRFASFPTVETSIFQSAVAAGNRPNLAYKPSSGKFSLLWGAAAGTDVGPVLALDTWYLVDLDMDVSANPNVLKAKINGGTEVTVNEAQAATTLVNTNFGTTAAATYTALYDDWAYSQTGADYPLPAHKVLGLHPNGDGTHVISGAGDFDKGDGTDILVSTTDAWLEIDDWITGVADTTTYVQDTAGASTEYTEHTFDDTTEATIWAAVGFCACFASATTACNLTVRIVDSGGATVADIFSGDPSETALHYRSVLVQQNPTQAQVNAYKVRIGLSTDVAPDPRCSAVMLQIVVPEAAGQTATYTVAAETDSALAFIHSKLAPYGVAAEADSALAFIADRLILYGIAAETDSALAFIHEKLASYGVAVEADSALSFLADRLHLYGVAVETDSALAFLADRLHLYGTAAEVDAALAFIASVGEGGLTASYGVAAEVDTALAFIASLPLTVLYGLALETDLALSFDIKTARVYEGFEISGGPFGPGINKKRKKFAIGKGRTMP